MTKNRTILNMSQFIRDLENADDYLNDREDAYSFIVGDVLCRVHELHDILTKLSELELPEVTKVLNDAGVIL